MWRIVVAGCGTYLPNAAEGSDEWGSDGSGLEVVGSVYLSVHRADWHDVVEGWLVDQRLAVLERRTSERRPEVAENRTLLYKTAAPGGQMKRWGENESAPEGLILPKPVKMPLPSRRDALEKFGLVAAMMSGVATLAFGKSQANQAAPFPVKRKPVVPLTVIKAYELVPTREYGFWLLGEDGLAYSLEDVMRVVFDLLKSHVQSEQRMKK